MTLRFQSQSALLGGSRVHSRSGLLWQWRGGADLNAGDVVDVTRFRDRRRWRPARRRRQQQLHVGLDRRHPATFFNLLDVAVHDERVMSHHRNFARIRASARSLKNVSAVCSIDT